MPDFEALRHVPERLHCMNQPDTLAFFDIVMTQKEMKTNDAHKLHADRSHKNQPEQDKPQKSQH